MFIKRIFLYFLIFLLYYSLLARVARTPLHPLTVSSINIQNPGYRPVITHSPRARCQPGPKPKPLSNWVYKPRGPIRRIRRTYSRERKIEVLLFLTYHRICHKSWLSKVDFTWLILISHKVCWFCTMTSLWLIAFTWLRTSESLFDYDWLMVSWLKIVTSDDVMIFTHDSYYESWVARMGLIWAHDRVYGFWSMERDVRSWLIRVSWWISHYDSLWVIEVMLREVMSHQG